MIEDSTKFELTDELKEKIDNIFQPAHAYLLLPTKHILSPKHIFVPTYFALFCPITQLSQI